MPRFCRDLSGPRVTVKPQVMSGATSPGQQVCTGKRDRSTSEPSHTISWHGAEARSLGAICITCMNTGRVFCHASFNPFGGSGSLRNARSLPTSRSASTDSSPIASATRSGVPNRLPSTGMRGRPSAPSKPFGLSNSNAGPAALSTRSQISVISRRGSTSTPMRLSSPRCSSWTRKSRRSAYFIGRRATGHGRRGEASYQSARFTLLTPGKAFRHPQPACTPAEPRGTRFPGIFRGKMCKSVGRRRHMPSYRRHIDPRTGYYPRPRLDRRHRQPLCWFQRVPPGARIAQGDQRLRIVAAAFKACLGIFALSLTTVGLAAPAGTESAIVAEHAPVVTKSPAIRLLSQQTGLAGTCGGSAFDVDTFIDVDTFASADVKVDAPGVGLIEEFTDETGTNLGPYNAVYPTFHIRAFGGGLPP